MANTFFRAGFIEAWERGIEKIKDSCKEAGNPKPEYTVATRILKVIQEEPSLSQKKRGF